MFVLIGLILGVFLATGASQAAAVIFSVGPNKCTFISIEKKLHTDLLDHATRLEEKLGGRERCLVLAHMLCKVIR